MRRALTGGILVLALLCALALGAGGAALFLMPSSPQALSPREELRVAAVHEAEFADPRGARIIMEHSGDTEVPVHAAGTVTAFSCHAGRPLPVDAPALFIDGIPLLTVATETPPWRDLRPGDRGEDVRALSAFLRAGGAALPEGDRASAALIARAHELRTAAGAPRPEDPALLPRSALLWVPPGEHAVTRCALSRGAAIAPGSIAAVIGGTLEAVRLEFPPGALLPGERVAVISGEEVPLDAEGALSDPARLDGIRALPAYREAREAGIDSLAVSIQLAEPVGAGRVPPGALFGVGATHACVITPGGDALRVELLGSALGQSIVRAPAGRELPERVRLDPAGGGGCP